MVQISRYNSESILTSKSASIDAKAPEIHHRTMLHAIHQKTMDINKLVHENRIFCSSFLCNIAIINKIHSTAKGSTHKYGKICEYLRSSKSTLHNNI